MNPNLCPFCRSTAEPVGQDAHWQVRCGQCGAAGPVADNPQDAVTRWNDAPAKLNPINWEELLATVAKKHYDQVTMVKDVDGAQMWNGRWWAPIWGCDTLGNLLDDLEHAIEKKLKS